jgi:nucleoside-diphosphate-sugar epimerase
MSDLDRAVNTMPNASPLRPKTILVTGGRGFIGTQLVRALAKRDDNNIVVSIDRRPVKEAGAGKTVELVADVLEPDTLRALFRRFTFDLVFDLASITTVGLPAAEYEANADMTRAIVQRVEENRTPKYVFFSTQFVFRKPGVAPTTDTEYHPIEAYGESKIESELYIRRNLEPGVWTILRPTYVWGSGNVRFRDGFLYRLKRRQLCISNAADLYRYYGYVDTVCEQAIALGNGVATASHGATFYLSDPAISMAWFCELFIRHLGGGGFIRLPGQLVRLLGYLGDAIRAAGVRPPITSLQAREMTCDFPIDLARTLQYAPMVTNYEEAAAAVVRWARLGNERLR